MKKWLMAVLLGTLLVLGACGGGNDDAQEPADTEDEATEETTDDAAETDDATDDAAEEGGSVDASAAEELYKQSCASCHGADLSGQGSFPSLKGTGLSAEEIETIILEGRGSMPAQLLTGDDAKTVAEWLATQ